MITLLICMIILIYFDYLNNEMLHCNSVELFHANEIDVVIINSC